MNKREWYSEIKFLKENNAHKNGLKPLYDRKVRLLRAEEKKSDYYGLDVQIVVQQRDFGAVIRIPLGIVEEDAHYEAECIAERLAIPYKWTDHDCTGQLFTAWQEVHYMAGQWWLWQYNCMDV